MRIVKVEEQIIGDTKLDVYELHLKSGSRMLPAASSFDSISELPLFKKITLPMERYWTVAINSAQGSTMRLKVERKCNPYAHMTGDGMDIDSWQFYRELISVPRQ
ncbi:MAG: hypothetical protein EOP06_06825 [Proteobacteria bacterium]|nr:MAG: hypothetical protein EOP06_06825 [Pseudomonadota bacterium]